VDPVDDVGCPAQVGRIDQARARRVQLGDEAGLLPEAAAGGRLEGARGRGERSGGRDAAYDRVALCVDADAAADVVAEAAEIGDVRKRLAVRVQLGDEGVGGNGPERRLGPAGRGGIDGAGV